MSSRKVALIANCLLNQNAKVCEGARYRGLVSPVVEALRSRGYLLVQLPCPELAFAGARRWWAVYEQYDTPAYRAHCRRLAQAIAPLIASHPNVEYIGEITDAQKSAFLGNASALLFPIDWPEPFGLVMIEAMACGTPVVAFRSASVPEVIDDGLTGFIVKDMDEAVAAVARLDTLDRAAIRTTFERRFTVERMARDYLAIYRALPGVPEVPDDSDESLLQEAGLALRAA